MQTDIQRIMLAQRTGCAPQIIHSVLGGFVHLMNVSLRTLIKLQRGHFYNTVRLGTICKMYALVDRQTSDLAEFVIAVHSDRAETVRSKGGSDRSAAID